MAFQFPQPPRHEHAFARPLDPEPASLPHWRCTLTDRGAWPDPLQPLAFPFWTPPGLEAFAVNGARFEAAASEMPSAGLWLGLDAYEAIVAEVGYDDDAQQSEEPDTWIAQAEAATAPILALIRQADGTLLREWRGEHEVLWRSAEAVCRSHGLSDGAVGRVVGRPYVRRRSLFKAAAIARELEAKKRADVQAREAVQAAALAVQVEDDRPRTLGELQVHAFAVKRDRLGDSGAVVLPGLGGHAVMVEPWHGASRFFVFELDETNERVFAFNAWPALCSPPWSRDGIRTLDPSTMVPRRAMTPADPDVSALGFLQARRVEAGLNFGPITGPLRSEVPSVATSLLRASAPLLLSSAPQHFFRVDVICETLVRSELALRPDVALVEVLLALDQEFKRRNPPTRVPCSPPHIEHVVDGPSKFVPPAMREIRMYQDAQLPSNSALRTRLGDRLAEAVQRGRYVEVNAPLDPFAAPAASKTKKGK